MIKANELRKGVIIIDYTGIVREVTGEDIQQQCWHEEGQTGTTEAPLNSIPLTPEWLERLGFTIKHEATEDEPLTYSILKLDLDIAKEGDGYYLRYECQDSYYDSNIGVRIEYVHQLQNLFFALTGEELNVKI